MKGELWRQGSFLYDRMNFPIIIKTLREGAERRSEWNGDVTRAMADG